MCKWGGVYCNSCVTEEVVPFFVFIVCWSLAYHHKWNKTLLSCMSNALVFWYTFICWLFNYGSPVCSSLQYWTEICFDLWVVLIFCTTFARSLRVKSITVSLLLSSNSAGLSNPLLSDSFGDTLTIATTKGMQQPLKKDFLGLCNNFPGLNVR